MKKTIATVMLAVLSLLAMAQKWETPDWKNFRYPTIHFLDKAKGTQGSKIYNRIVPNPKAFIQQHALWVVQTLYWSTSDSIPNVKAIKYTLEDIEGISAKGGQPPVVNIFYSSQWVEKSESSEGDDKVLYETRGVLYHELTHAYQLEPQGIGGYQQGTEFWVFIEGMADAVRFHNGFFPVSDRKPGGNWMDGYRKTGYFLEWLTCKDPDFLRKFNRSTLEIIPWSFDKAMQHVLGKNVTTDSLWAEYQKFLTDN